MLVAISVPKLEDSVSGYQKNPGFKVTERKQFPAPPQGIAFLQRDGFRLELVELKDSFSIKRYVPDLDNPAHRQTGLGCRRSWRLGDSACKKGVSGRFDLRKPQDEEEAVIAFDSAGSWFWLTPLGALTQQF